MTLDRLIELQKQFKEEDVTPLVQEYQRNYELMQSLGYDFELSKQISIYNIKKRLIDEAINYKNGKII